MADNPAICTITNNGSGYINSGAGTQLTTVNYLDFVKREGVWRSAIFRDVNTPLTFASTVRAKYEGNPIRGQVIKVQIVNRRQDASVLRSVSVGFTPSKNSFQ